MWYIAMPASRVSRSMRSAIVAPCRTARAAAAASPSRALGPAAQRAVEQLDDLERGDLGRVAGEAVAALDAALGGQDPRTAQRREQLLEELHRDVAPSGQLPERHRSVPAGAAQLGEGLQGVGALGGDREHRGYGHSMAAVSRFGPAVALMGLIFALSAQPDLSSGLGDWDLVLRKLAHMAEYGLLFVLWRRALPGAPRWTAAAIAVGYAVSDEIHQSFVEGRHGSPVDVAIDATGVALGWLATARWARRRDG